MSSTFAGFLFGNINEEGELEDEEILGRNEVAQLTRLGVVGVDDVVDEDVKDSNEDDVQDLSDSGAVTGEDFADINELAEDECEKERLYNKGKMFIESTNPSADNEDYDDDGEEGEEKDKLQLTSDTETTTEIKGETDTNIGTHLPPQSTTSLFQQTLPSTFLSTSEQPQEPQTLVDDTPSQTVEEHPLLPEGLTEDELLRKVMEHFPTFKRNSILRFSSLIRPKPSSLPDVWKDCKKRKRRPSGERTNPEDWTFKFGPQPGPEMVDNQEERFLTPVAIESERQGDSGKGTMVDEETREWRYGPAKVWYDMFNVPEDGSDLDYGFKLKSVAADDEGKPPSECGETLPDDAFLMVTQLPWENDIMYYIPPATGPPVTAQGGMWTSVDMKQSNAGTTEPFNGLHPSMFPVHNPDLIYKNWEDDIIIDSNAISHFPKPTLPRLDPNDPNIIIGIPDEPVVTVDAIKDGKKDNKKNPKSWNKSSTNNKTESSSSLAFTKKDQFNLSNDEYYNPNHVSSTHGLPGIDSSNVVQHSIPALDLYMPWFPTHWSAHALRYFHRPRLKIKVTNSDDSTGWQVINNLSKNITKKEKEREKERIMSGGGEVFFMRSPEDLSACDGQVLLSEYSEEHPPLVMATGMSTKIKNYYRRPEKVKSGPPVFSYGETTYIQSTSYFLGSLKPGQSLQSFECNLFRAPIYFHTVSDTDFLLVRIDNNFYIREIKDLFVVGQECPKVEVPAPNSKTVNQFQKDFLQVYLYRLFQESDDRPKKIKMEMVRRAFPPSVMSESVIRKVLKQFADFKREGYESGSWVLRADVRLPTEEEIRAMVTPEQACAFFSMLAAEQRLKDAGYGGKSLFAVEEEEEGEDSSQKIDDEVRAAPWNTTHHFINAMKGKYQLAVNGPADPTGCGEGFSYTRLNPKETSGNNPSISPNKRPKTVMGTEADLRKLKLNKARAVLRNFGVPEEEISKLSRWKVIDLVRTISTEAARSGGVVDVNSLMFARGTRFSQMEAQERYKEECQRVFDLQNRVLSSTEVLSTDEESSGSERDSDDELGRNLESLLSSKKTALDLTHEQEELERQELRRLLIEDQPISGKSSTDQHGGGDQSERAVSSLDMDDLSSVHSFSSITGRRLVISRTFRDENGREYVRHEVVKNQGVIDAYVRIMSGSKDKDIRMEFAEKDEKTREDMRKEVKRLQSQIRQLDRAEERAKQKPQKPKKKEFTAMHLTCSACGQKGHMKTNKNCPNYKNQPVQVAPTDAELAAAQNETPLAEDDLVKVEGTKVVLKRDLLEHAEDVRRRSLVLKFPKEKIRKRRRHGDEPLDYLEKKAKAGQRRRTNPEVPFAALLEKIVNKLSGMTEFWAFCKPVSAKDVPDYYNLIKFPMDLQTMKDNIRKHKYETREQFREHVNLIVNNCITYNGFNSELTKNAQKMLETCNEEIKQNDKELEQLEHEINPLLGDDPQAAISFLCRKCVDKMKSVPNSWPFHFPVSSKKLPDYHIIITKPMDLQTMRKKCEVDQYRNREEFLVDLNQIVDNSITYNGPTSPFTQTAQSMREVGLQFLEQEIEYFIQYEPLLRDQSKSPRGSSVQGSDLIEQGSFVMSGEDEEIASVSSAVMLMDEGESMVLDSGHVPIVTGVATSDIDVEGLDNDEGTNSSLLPVRGGMDILREDLQYSSSSNEEEYSEMEDV